MESVESCGNWCLDKVVESVETLSDVSGVLSGSWLDLPGVVIRHALMNEPSLDLDDAKFMLVSCSVFINYLKEKSLKAEINLQTKWFTISLSGNIASGYPQTSLTQHITALRILVVKIN